MKICYFTHNLRHDNGGGVLSARLCEGMQERGMEVIALTTVPSGKSYERPLLSGGTFTIFLRLREIREICKSVDIINALDAYPYGVLARVASLGLGKPLVITTVGTGSIAGLYLFPQKVLMKWAYHSATAITSISTFTKTEVLKMVKGITIGVISLGVDPARFTTSAHAELPSAVRTPYILSVGSLRWRKGYKFSIQAFAHIAKEYPELSYVIVGKRFSEKEYAQMTALIERLDLVDRVHILDTIDDDLVIRALYKNAYAFVLLSQNVRHDVEGFGLVFLEAAASGIPAIGAKDSGVVDAMDEGTTGFLVPPQDTEACAGALRKLLNNKALRNKMGEDALLYAKAHTWEVTMDAYRDLYRSLFD